MREIVIRKKYIYAMDVSQQIIFVFDKNGSFVAKLDKRGPGADEYTFMGPVFIDNNEEYIELINYRGESTTKLKYSNISFELLEVSPFPDVSCNSCKRNKGFYYFLTQQQENIVDDDTTNAGLVIVDENKNKRLLFDKKIETGHLYFSPVSESFAQNNANELFVSLMYDDTFYRLEAGEAYPFLTVDFGKYSMDNFIGLKSTGEQLEYIKNMNGIASFPVLNIENSNMMSFSYYFKQDEQSRMYRETDFRQYIKIKKNNKVYHGKKIINDITSFPNHIYVSSYFFNCVHEVLYEDYLVDIIVPNYYFSDDKVDKVFVDGIGEVTAYDNPLVVMMKLK